jgi:anthranilate synthase component 1
LGLVDQSKDYIRQGQVFQIVISQRFSLPCRAAALDVYRVLQAINPSPYAYYLKIPGAAYIGSSPETFVRCIDGEMSLRAIAGTRPRGADPAQDAALEVELKSNEKELAEHYMLVDLGRNDVGRVCQVGSIKLGELASLTRYTHVMHLSTEISGRLRNGKTAFDAFKSCFPRGTVSGAPKVRAMQLLSKLEPEQRGIYSGVVGYFDFKGNTDGAIAIRSALIKDGVAHINAGAGIVLDSDPLAEYEETRNKAKSVVKAVVAANLMREAKQCLS